VGPFAHHVGLKHGPFAANVSRTEGILVGPRDYVCGSLQLAAFPVQSVALCTSLKVARDLLPLTAIMIGNILTHKTGAVRMVDALCGTGGRFLLRIE